MTHAEHLVRRLRAAGWSVELSGAGPQLYPPREGATLDPKLLAAIKAARSAVVEFLAEHPEFQGTECSLCGRSSVTAEDRPHLIDPALCDRGGTAPQRSRGGVVTPGVPRCPFKPTGSVPDRRAA